MNESVGNSASNVVQTSVNNSLLSKKSTSAKNDDKEDTATTTDKEQVKRETVEQKNDTLDALGLYDKEGIVKVNRSEDTTQTPKGDSKTTSFLSDGGQIVVNVNKSDSVSGSKIHWSSDNFQNRPQIGIDNQTGTYNLGTFEAGTKINFGTDNRAGEFSRPSTVNRKADNYEPVQTQTNNRSTAGDQDINDANIIITKPIIKKETRTALEDGANSDQGSPKVNISNTVINNPPNEVFVSNHNPVSGAEFKALYQSTGIAPKDTITEPPVRAKDETTVVESAGTDSPLKSEIQQTSGVKQHASIEVPVRHETVETAKYEEIQTTTEKYAQMTPVKQQLADNNEQTSTVDLTEKYLTVDIPINNTATIPNTDYLNDDFTAKFLAAAQAESQLIVNRTMLDSALKLAELDIQMTTPATDTNTNQSVGLDNQNSGEASNSDAPSNAETSNAKNAKLMATSVDVKLLNAILLQ